MIRNLLRAVAVCMVPAWLALANPASAQEFTPPENTPVVPWTRFSIQYAVRRVGQLSKVEFYITTDGGQTWQVYGDDPDMKSPMLISVRGDGNYGFYTVARGPNQRGDRPPRVGTRPDTFIIVDRTPPTAEWLSPNEDQLLGPEGIRLAWKVEDAHLGPTPVTIQYSTDGGNMWLPLKENLPAESTFNWQPPVRSGNNLLFRLVARDKAGNGRNVINSSMVRIDSVTPTARIVRPTMSGKQAFDVEYIAEDNNGGTGIGKVELYATYDEGRNWRLVGTDTDLSSPVPFSSEIANGRVGLMLVAADKANNRSPLPQPGMAPPFVTIVDTVPPTVSIDQSFTGGRTKIPAGEPTTIRWAATDPNIKENSANLAFSANGGQTWNPIGTNLPVNQPHYWTPPADTDSRECYIRLTVSDTLGNVGRHESQVFGVDKARPNTIIETIETQPETVEPLVTRTPDEGISGPPSRFGTTDTAITPPSGDTPPTASGSGGPTIEPPLPTTEIPSEDRINEGLAALVPIDPLADRVRARRSREDSVEPTPPPTPTIEDIGIVIDDDTTASSGIGDLPSPGDLEDIPSLPILEETTVAETPRTPETDGGSIAAVDPESITVPPVPPIPDMASTETDMGALTIDPMDPIADSGTSDQPAGVIPEIGDPVHDDPTIRDPGREALSATQPGETSIDSPSIDIVIPQPGPVEPPLDTAATAANAQKAKALVDQAQDAYLERNYDVANDLLIRALALNPRNPKALALHASVLTEKSEFENAISQAQLAIRLAPNMTAYQQALGDAHYAYATSLFYAIQDMTPDAGRRNVTSLQNRMNTEFDQAEEAFRRLAADTTLSKIGYFKLGQIYYFKGNKVYPDKDSEKHQSSLRTAIDQFIKATLIGEPEYRELLQTGICFFKLGDFEKSKGWLQRAADVPDIDTDLKVAFFYLAMIHTMLNEPNEALSYWLKVKRMYPAGSKFHNIATQQIDSIEQAAGDTF